MAFVHTGLAAIYFRHWWVILLRGLVAIGFGVLLWLQPGISLTALILLFGAFTMADGLLNTWTAIAERKDREYWWLLLLGGLLGVGVGLITFFAPGITAMALLFYIAVWAITLGVIKIVTAIQLRKEIKGEWLLILSGLLSVVFGIALMAQPGVGALAILWLIAAYAIVFGILLVLLAFKARSFLK